MGRLEDNTEIKIRVLVLYKQQSLAVFRLERPTLGLDIKLVVQQEVWSICRLPSRDRELKTARLVLVRDARSL
jgi:hypothetical protein